MKKALLFLFLAYAFASYSQSNQSLRLEVDLKNVDKNTVVPIGKSGLLLLQQEEGSKKGQKTWRIVKYNTDLKEISNKSIEVSKDLDLYRYYIDEVQSAAYILFSKFIGVDHYNYTKGDFILYKVSLDDLSTSRISGEIKKAMSILKIVAINDNVLFGGHSVMTQKEGMLRMCASMACCYIPVLFGSLHKNTKVVYYTADFRTGKLKEQKLEQYKGSARINDISIDQQKKAFSLLIENSPTKKEYFMFLHEISTTGGKNSILPIKVKDDKAIANGRVTYTKDGEILLFGTYANNKPVIKIAANTTDTRVSNGIYCSKVVNGKQQFLKYYNFTDFSKFYEMLGARLNSKALAKVKKKQEKVESKGKELAVNYSLLVHDIIAVNDTYVLVAEAFYAEYHTEYYTDCSSGKCVTRSRQVFDGYRYTHAIVAGFSKNGDLLWDNAFEIYNILTKQLKERVKAVLQPDNSIILAYNWNGKVHSKIIRGNEVLNHKQSESIETFYTDDKVKSNSDSDIDFWYDNFLIAHGIQRIKNKTEGKTKGVDKNREVLYVNKISYQ